MVFFVHIPFDEQIPLETLVYSPNPEKDVNDFSGDFLPAYLLVEAAKKGLDEKTEIDVTPLKRLTGRSDKDAGIFSYSYRTFLDKERIAKKPNVRATTLIIACGLHSRCIGDTFIGRFGYNSSGKLCNLDITAQDIYSACLSPDIRINITTALREKQSSGIISHNLLIDAAMENYKDGASLLALASAMDYDKTIDSLKDDSTDYELSDNSSIDSNSNSDDFSTDGDINSVKRSNGYPSAGDQKKMACDSTLCLNCRAPSNILCSDCKGAYFCVSSVACERTRWSHQCLCQTWAYYTKRRAQLSSFCFDSWHLQMMDRPYQTSESQYRSWLQKMNVLGTENGSWWTTEIDGWAAGLSGSASQVDASVRRSYQEGFLLDSKLIPPERHIVEEDYCHLTLNKNQCNLLQIHSWSEYYELRKIPLSSPVALLCTFPLTIYYAIEKYGSVPVTVARMLCRPLRIHAVGIEKEMNFLDLFKELGYLLPKDLEVELCFVVRQDMLPPKCRDNRNKEANNMKLKLTSNLTLLVKSGTYGEDLNPLFDIGTGPPDMVIGLNAGLFAYESWRSAISFLHNNPSVVAVFTDYNEHSGMNCAALGGGQSRESLVVNPFRQPRAMPVYCMNLPQFSNGFIYVWNEQQLE